ncbi:MAG TPA: hypothetical protein VGO68_05220 [Pyrinomonadaceae bacterium]|nr:hypothetical protein [Pyrinomonadaceae bacterium]
MQSSNGARIGRRQRKIAANAPMAALSSMAHPNLDQNQFVKAPSSMTIGNWQLAEEAAIRKIIIEPILLLFDFICLPSTQRSSTFVTRASGY